MFDEFFRKFHLNLFVNRWEKISLTHTHAKHLNWMEIDVRTCFYQKMYSSTKTGFSQWNLYESASCYVVDSIPIDICSIIWSP